MNNKDFSKNNSDTLSEQSEHAFSQEFNKTIKNIKDILKEGKSTKDESLDKLKNNINFQKNSKKNN